MGSISPPSSGAGSPGTLSPDGSDDEADDVVVQRRKPNPRALGTGAALITFAAGVATLNPPLAMVGAVGAFFASQSDLGSE